MPKTQYPSSHRLGRLYATIPIHPVNVPFSGFRNFTESAAAAPIAIAFTPKQILNAKGE